MVRRRTLSSLILLRECFNTKKTPKLALALLDYGKKFVQAELSDASCNIPSSVSV